MQEQIIHLVIFQPFLNAILVILVCAWQSDQAIPPLVFDFTYHAPRSRYRRRIKEEIRLIITCNCVSWIASCAWWTVLVNRQSRDCFLWQTFAYTTHGFFKSLPFLNKITERQSYVHIVKIPARTWELDDKTYARNSQYMWMTHHFTLIPVA